MRISLLLSFLVILAFPFVAVAQETAPETLKIKAGLYLLVSPQGGNVVVSSGEDGTFLIDDQLAGRSEVISQAVAAISSQPADFILNTHYHFDHTGGNEAFGAEGAVIVAHDNVRKRLSTKQFITHFKREMKPLGKAGLPVVTFAQEVTFHYNGETIHVLHVPDAHTDGDAIAHFEKENVIVAGDVIFNGLYPFIDTEHGGSIKGVINALDAITARGDRKTLVVPGHGPVMKMAEVKAYREMLAKIASRIEEGIEAGKSREEVIASKPTQEFDGHMAGDVVSPDAFVGMLYDDLRGAQH